MKATELMIGDWVINNALMPDESYKINQPMKVDELWKSFVSMRNDHACGIIHYEDADPIPLTEELLKMNGWEGDTHAYCTLRLDKFSHLEFYWYARRLRKYWQGVDEWNNHQESRDITFQCDCNYVHELQHALRLCGLNGLADNFKLKEDWV